MPVLNMTFKDFQKSIFVNISLKILSYDAVELIYLVLYCHHKKRNHYIYDTEQVFFSLIINKLGEI